MGVWSVGIVGGPLDVVHGTTTQTTVMLVKEETAAVVRVKIAPSVPGLYNVPGMNIFVSYHAFDF